MIIFIFASMKITSTKILSTTILSFLVLFSSFSIAINEHYCGKKLVDTAINTSAKSCCASKNKTKEKGCCNDKTEILKSSLEFHAQSFEFSLSHSDFIIETQYVFAKNKVEFTSKNNFVYKNYTPPKIHYDFQIMNQTFLI